jgi:dTDP-4-dehydrorhamnose reductase
MNCSSDEYVTKAKRPEWSILKNDSKIVLSDWKMGFRNYLQGK